MSGGGQLSVSVRMEGDSFHSVHEPRQREMCICGGGGGGATLLFRIYHAADITTPQHNNDAQLQIGRAASKGHAEICKYLMAGGVDAKIASTHGVTALHEASREGEY